MSDAYMNFANSAFGARVANLLGLPKPVPLARFVPGQPVVEGEVLVAAGGTPQLLPVLSQAFAAMQARSVAHASVPGWTALANQAGLMSGPWGFGEHGGGPLKAVVFDATGLHNAAQGEALHLCFHAAARAIEACGRVVVIGRPPEDCTDPRQAAVQRALEGFVRALGKELKRGITAQTVLVADGAEHRLEGTLRFLLSPRSAYVSGQVIRLGAYAGPTPCDWAQPLAGRKIMVTGAARGIGAAIAETLARDGAHVVCVDVPQSQDALHAVAERLQAQAIALDITHEDAAATLAEAARADGGWDGVVHNAGITRDKTIARMAPHLWHTLVQVNLLAPEAITQALLDAGALRAKSRVVCVSSISGIAGNLGQTNYAFSKAGVIGLVQGLAPRMAGQGMAINAVAPGFIETQMTAAIPLAIREAGRRMNSMGQGGQAVDVAEAIAWLLSPASQGVNGQVLRVCGQSLIGA
ncbi:MAG: 3-oxoacyl-ACP reductase [Betaproteobacteria bacterium]|nr:3-oxoacyl-ACP reductase [Betaproteobacteria bacterium]